MKQTITFSDFRDAFRLLDRAEQFSRPGMQVLYDWLEDFDPDYEIDVIGLCCEWYESSASEIIAENSLDLEPSDLDALEEWLSERTTVAGRVGDGFVYGAF